MPFVLIGALRARVCYQVASAATGGLALLVHQQYARLGYLQIENIDEIMDPTDNRPESSEEADCASRYVLQTGKKRSSASIHVIDDE
jgi:hypothetical protein